MLSEKKLVFDARYDLFGAADSARKLNVDPIFIEAKYFQYILTIPQTLAI